MTKCVLDGAAWLTLPLLDLDSSVLLSKEMGSETLLDPHFLLLSTTVTLGLEARLEDDTSLCNVRVSW